MVAGGGVIVNIASIASKVGILDQETLLDCSAFGEDWDEKFFGREGLERLAAWLETEGTGAPRVEASSVRLAPAIARPSKIVCIGLNYALHAAESGMEPPKEPVVFFKSTSAWSGPNDDIMIPRHSDKTDWEVELAVVIGRKAKYVSESEALDHVAGYAVHNDYSERAWQLERGGQWVKAKSADTYAPFGPHKGVVQLALASVTNACWDLLAKKRGLPLWRLPLDLTPGQILATLDRVVQLSG